MPNRQKSTKLTLSPALDDRSIVLVGLMGAGKTSIGNRLFEDVRIDTPSPWPKEAPIIDAIAPDGDFDAVTTALSSVGLGSVPAWLRPYGVLSTGERFRADLARFSIFDIFFKIENF